LYPLSRLATNHKIDFRWHIYPPSTIGVKNFDGRAIYNSSKQAVEKS